MERRHPVGGARASLPALSAKRELRSRRDNVSTTASAGVYATTLPFALRAQCGQGCPRSNRTSSILPIHIHKSRPARWHRVLMIVSCFPGHCAVRGNLYELKLDGLTGRYARVEKPVRIIRRQHRPDGSVPSRGPVAQLDGAPSKKDIVARLRRRSVVNRESHGNQFRRQHGVLNAVRNLARRIGYRNVVYTIGDLRRGADDLRRLAWV